MLLLLPFLLLLLLLCLFLLLLLVHFNGHCVCLLPAASIPFALSLLLCLFAFCFPLSLFLLPPHVPSVPPRNSGIIGRQAADSEQQEVDLYGICRGRERARDMLNQHLELVPYGRQCISEQITVVVRDYEILSVSCESNCIRMAFPSGNKSYIVYKV